MNDHNLTCGYKRMYAGLKDRYEILWEWYIKTREHYDGMMNRKEIEQEERRRLDEAVRANDGSI